MSPGLVRPTDSLNRGRRDRTTCAADRECRRHAPSRPERPALGHSAEYGKPSALRGGEVQYLDREERWGFGELEGSAKPSCYPGQVGHPQADLSAGEQQQ